MRTIKLFAFKLISGIFFFAWESTRRICVIIFNFSVPVAVIHLHTHAFVHSFCEHEIKCWTHLTIARLISAFTVLSAFSLNCSFFWCSLSCYCVCYGHAAATYCIHTYYSHVASYDLFNFYALSYARTHLINTALSHPIANVIVVAIVVVALYKSGLVKSQFENLNFTCKRCIRNAFIDGIKCAPPLVEHQTNYFNQFIKFAAYTHTQPYH